MIKSLSILKKTSKYPEAGLKIKNKWDLDTRNVQENIDIFLRDPGNPWQIGTDKSINGKFRNEWLPLK